MKQQKNMKALFIIVNAGYADEVIEIALSKGAGGATILNARGEGGRHEVFMGITVDTEKEIVISLVPDYVAEKIMAVIEKRAGVKTPIHGVCFTMAVENYIGINIPQQSGGKIKK